MKIALVILHADPSRGGAERYTVDLASVLARRGHDVFLMATTFAGLPEAVKQVPLAANGFTRTSQYRHMLDSLDAHLDRHKYDIIHAMLPIRHCHVYHPHAGLAAAARMSLFTPRRKAMAEVEQHLLYSPKPPRVLCLSEYVKQSVKKHYPLDTAHLPILFNAADLERFVPSEKPTRDTPIALMIAQDFERKGLHQTLTAMAQMNDKGLRLRVVGKEDTQKYQRIAAQLGIADRVDFAGPTTDPASEYRNADFFVLPTRHDPCSLVVLEALAMGLPVISTRFNGACEIMTDGEHGFVLTAPNDIDALSNAMKKLLDPQIRSKMSAACLALRPTLSYEHHLDRLIQIYEQSAVESNRPGTTKQGKS